ncbi:MAG: lytic transglycosylase domain-containing protein [Pseudomonadales bacterium]|nr:lytic transglycosylase domain-containing protein [Pseudomonadales bacterium]
MLAQHRTRNPARASRLARVSAVLCLWLATALAGLPALAIEPNSPLGRNAQIDDADLKDFLQQSLAAEQNAAFDKYDAEVWLESMLSRMRVYKPSHEDALAILQAVYREAYASDLPPDLVLAVISIESAFNRFAVSRVGAQGLMQVMPFWKQEIGRPGDNLMDIDVNVRYGCKILQYYIKRSNGDLSEALARYNGSYGRTVYSEKVMLNWERRWQSGRLSKR